MLLVVYVLVCCRVYTFCCHAFIFDPVGKEVYLSGELEVWLLLHSRMSRGNIQAIFSSVRVWNVSI